MIKRKRFSKGIEITMALTLMVGCLLMVPVAMKLLDQHEKQEEAPVVVVEQPVQRTKPQWNYNISVEDLLIETNKLRTEAGLRVLDRDPALENSAAQHCAYIAQTGVYEHGNWQDYLKPLGRSWYGENLAIDAYNSKITTELWKNSPTHYANIVNRNHTRVGFAICDFDAETKLVVQHFSN